jgi:hypothetical protein
MTQPIEPNTMPTPQQQAIINQMPKPVYPTMDMPQRPAAPHQLGEDITHPDCEGHAHAPMDAANSPVPPPPEGMNRILIGIPLLAITYEFFESFMKFWTELNISQDQKYEVGYHIAYRKPVHMAEEHLANVACYNKCTHLLLMDDDIYDITKADLDKLIDADKDVIGGVMHASKFPHAMCVFRRYNKERKVIDMPVDDSMYRLYEVPCTCPKCNVGLSHWDAKFCPACGSTVDNLIQQADLIPFAFTLIKIDVFSKIKWPWFHCTTKYPTDSWFSDRLIEAGMTEYAHMGVRLNHAGITDETKPHFVQMGMIKAREKNGVVELTPKQMQDHQDLLMQKMRETELGQREKPVFSKEGAPTANKEAIGGKNTTLVTHGR